ncbi:MAG: DEAD/DEAH box helicase family protein [Candidatus Melainabacteria bacterium]|nr:DEAD/DEAH box helicase family protein [Candidatus Melainabacteria bacterium]
MQTCFEQLSLELKFDNIFANKDVRAAQIGAIHAFLAHNSVHSTPALIAMPTGAGKTAVLMLIPILVKAKRVLVITSNRLVRAQIVEDFSCLNTLRKIGVVKSEVRPRTYELHKKITTNEQWEQLKEFDVVVALPQSFTPGLELDCPSDLFDVILFDEAHHTPANTWFEIYKFFKNSVRVLFTATPFRRDQNELPGKLIYAYPMQKALEDKIMNVVRFEYVPDGPSGEGLIEQDARIAKVTEQIFLRDRNAGLNHRLLVRANSISRADELAQVYSIHTKLKLALLNSSFSLAVITERINELRNGTIDGLICVDMLAEGFDLPELKIAAIHSPHRSLAVTLQFIGRFGRSKADSIGQATFISCRQEVQLEGKLLYEENSVWQKIIPELADIALANQEFAHATYSSFNSVLDPVNSLDPAILHTIRPFAHAKIYTTDISPNLAEPIRGFGKLVLHEISGDKNTLVFMTEEEVYPTWSEAAELLDYLRHIYILHYDAAGGFLFITTSNKQASTYLALVNLFCPHGGKEIAPERMLQVLADGRVEKFFSLGLKRKIQSDKTESYKIMSGASVQNSLTQADSVKFNQGHVMANVSTEEGTKSLGYSVSGKTWMNAYLTIPKLITWYKKLASQFRSNGVIVTNSLFDNVDTETLISKIDSIAFFIEWRKGWTDPELRLRIIDTDGVVRENSAMDLNFSIVPNSQIENSFKFQISGNEFDLLCEYQLNVGGFSIRVVNDESLENIYFIENGRHLSIENYLNANPPSFYTVSGEIICGNRCSRVGMTIPNLPANCFTPLDWAKERVNILSEKIDTPAGSSIHSYVGVNLSSDYQIFYGDDGANEIADFIGLTFERRKAVITLIHCKASQKLLAGKRVKDAYEVCGQALKGIGHFIRPESIFSHIESRFKKGSGMAKFYQGSEDGLRQFIAQFKTADKSVRVLIVQPGLSFKALQNTPVSRLLTTCHVVLQSYNAEFAVVCSA